METITAIATPHGTGGMAVIRISGPYAIQRAAEVFQPVNDISPLDMPGYRIAVFLQHLFHIFQRLILSLGLRL